MNVDRLTAPLTVWARAYDRRWLRPDLVAGLMAAPVAMAAYALAGTSRQLVVSATTATSAVSAATVGPMAGGDVARFGTLPAALALVVAVVLGSGAAAVRSGVGPRVEACADRLPVRARPGRRARAGAGPARRAGRGPRRHARRRGRIARGSDRRPAAGPRLPWTLLVLVLAIAVSALLDLGRSQLRLAEVRQGALETLRRSGVADRLPIDATIDVAVRFTHSGEPSSPTPG